MTIVADTYLSYESVGNREDLTDMIYDISPTETPFMSNGSRSKAKGILHEWQTDVLAAADTANAHLEGDDVAAFLTATPTVRLGNYAQISRKAIVVAGTLDAIDKAGRKTELAYQLAKRSAELKRDMESIALQNIGAVSGGATTARQMATLGAWIRTNTTEGATGSDPVAPTIVPAAGRTDATAGDLRALSETIFKGVCSDIWGSGGTLKMAMFGPINKQNASQFAGIATPTFYQSAVAETKIIGAADVYVSDFGTVSFVANRFQRERDGWLLDPEYYGFAFLRGFRQERLAKTGDAEKRLMLVEWTLVVKNEAAHGLVADLDSVIQ
jgi:hypothetical protein